MELFQDKERNNLSKHLQSLKNDLQSFLKLKDKKFAIKAYEGVQCINAEMEKILSLWKNMFSELEQSKSLTEVMIINYNYTAYGIKTFILKAFYSATLNLAF